MTLKRLSNLAGCICSAASLFIAGCGTLQVFSPKEAAQEPYRLQVEDELEIALGGNLSSTLKVPVKEDGNIYYPPVGSLPAAGRSLQELEHDIQNRLAAETPAATESGSSESKLPAEPVSPAEALNHLYYFQPGDQLEVTVWNHADLNQKAQIREDGSLTLSLIGLVSAAGRTLPDVEKEVTDRLNRDYIVNPQVTIRLSGAQFSLLGQKGESGSYPIESTMDLLTALSKGGDIAALRSSRVEIIRQQGEKRVVIHADVDRILHGKDPNSPILPRDTIYVQAMPGGSNEISIRISGAKFTALGEVTNPGTRPIESSVDLLTAISLAGGITKFGSNRVEIIRMAGDKRVVIRANMDRILKGKEPNTPIFPRDTLYVRRRLF